MHERKFVIKCLARDQNYINWIKDGTYSAQKIGATVIAFNYRGIDYSRGMVCTQNDMVNDTIAQVDRLLALGVRARNIGIEGYCLGGAVATLAAAQLHERDDKVKLHNSRSFRSIPRFLIGYFLPHTQSNWTEPMTWLRYIVAGFSLIFLSPIIWLSGWRFNAVNAWDKIPVADKDYSVVRVNEDVQYRTPEQADGLIHDHWASIASYLDEQRQIIQVKRKCGKTLTIEEQKILQDKPETHYFKPAVCEYDQRTKELFKAHGKLSHFLPSRHTVSIINPEETNQDYVAKQFKLRFQ
jgi:effector protein SdbA